MAEGNDQEKTEPATPKKREEARKKGQVVKSREVSSVAVLLCAMTVFYFGGGWMFSRMTDTVSSLLAKSSQVVLEQENAHTLFWEIFEKYVITLAPLLLLVAFVGIFSNVAQHGFLLTGEPLMPKLSKLDPLSGMKRLFSLRALVELLKSILKIAIIGTVAYFMLTDEMDKIPALIALNTGEILSFFGAVSLRLGFYTCLVLIVLAGLDYTFQRWQHERDLRMTKQEVKDEYKQREGDPMVRSRIRSAQREMAMRRMMDAVPEATVVITNPTHLAIAVKYEAGMHAPMVVAKGAGHIAARIREIAAEHDIPIIEQKPLARAIYKQVDIGGYIPSELYHAVAEILAYVYRLRGLIHIRGITAPGKRPLHRTVSRTWCTLFSRSLAVNGFWSNDIPCIRTPWWATRLSE